MPINEAGSILKKMWSMFWFIIALPMVIFASVVIVHQTGVNFIISGSIRIWGISLFIFSVTFGVALPVLLRTFFHGKYIKHKMVDYSEYVLYQRNMIVVCSIAVVSASVAYLLVLSPLYMYGSILAALYGVYSVMPFKEKIEGELKMYKLEEKKN